MSDEQPTSWRERFFGSTPAETPVESDAAADEQTEAEAEVTPDSAEETPAPAEVAAVSVEDHDDHQPLVESDDGRGGRHASDDSAGDDRVGDDRARDDDSTIEPTVIAPSTLRGPSHSASHPDEARGAADVAHGDAGESSLEQHPEAGHGSADSPAAAAGGEPPALVEPRRPSFGLRRRSDGEHVDPEPGDDTRDAASPEFSEPAPTQAIDAHGVRDQQATQAMDAQGIRDQQPTQAIDAQQGEDGAATRVLDAQPGSEQSTERFGIVRDEVPASSIPVDDETARAAASGGTPIVLVEEPMPPRRKGARGVGFAVALLATLVFAIVFAAAFFAVGYLFDREFDATATLESLWLQPSYLLPVVIFFLAYWIITLIVNRAGWWAHVLGAFIVALLVYAAHIVGAYMEQVGGWADYTEVLGIDAPSLGQLLLAPLSVLAFVVAREVPIWVGGIVSRRGRKARESNRRALDEFNAENAERLAAYERARA